MSGADPSAPEMAVSERYSYACHRCGRCCTGKRIQVNPYEVARIARNRGLSVAEVRARFTVGGEGAVLAQTESGACVFFGPQGCGVHPDRPLVCRLYPLGRHVDEAGRAWYSHVDLEPPPGGTAGQDGTIADYVAGQGAEPFIAAADAYFAWYVAASKRLGMGEAHVRREAQEVDDAAADLLDMDAAVERHCARAGIAPPQDFEARHRLHLEILYGHLDSAVPAAGL